MAETYSVLETNEYQPTKRAQYKKEMAALAATCPRRRWRTVAPSVLLDRFEPYTAALVGNEQSSKVER